MIGIGRAAKLLLVTVGCASIGVACSEGSHENDAGVVPDHNDFVVIAPELSGAAAEEKAFEVAPGHRTLYANRWGGTYTGGYDDASNNRSSIISGTRTISAFNGSDAQWSTLMTCLRDEFARWNVTVTDVNPGSTPHIEAVIGGHPSQLGYGNGTGGVAPLTGDCSVVEKAVVYVFSQNLQAGDNTCEVAAHEIGHALGLDHEYLCQDPMTYLYGCGHKTFQDSAQWCGEYSARQCQCSQKQNTVGHLNLRLGLASGNPTPTPTATPPPTGDNPPTVLAVSPAHLATLPGNGTTSVTADVDDADGDLTSVVLWWWKNNAWTSWNCETPPSHVTCSEENGTYTWSFQVGTGTRWWLVRAKDSSGNQVDSEMRKATFN